VSTNTESANLAPVSGAAGRYASALFDLARDSNAIEAVEGELATLQSAIVASSDLRAFLKSPVYGRDEQLAAICALASKACFGALVSNFLRLIAQNRRLSAL
jgi:F-type H+-transporting ATPase subunit delta